VRLTYSLSDLPFFVHHASASAMLPYLAPAAIAPIIIAILIGSAPAIFSALFISLFTSVIYGNRLDVHVFTFVASIIAVIFCGHVRNRTSIMRAAFYAGLAVAVFALLFGIIDQQAFWLPELTVPFQLFAALVNGLFTGVIVVGVLPLIENLFRRTTDITLLELTDYNRPLLRRMQMEAPGTYHHSLMVAQLAENAANAIGANTLLARVCALYHDIGKLNHPEYYSENQRDRVNPHDENNPSLSALIIKSHVKDGVDLAIKERLPRAVIDVIRQHHGTALIRYFYHRAVTGQRAAAIGYTNPPIPILTRGNTAPSVPAASPKVEAGVPTASSPDATADTAPIQNPQSKIQNPNTRPPFPLPAGTTRPSFPIASGVTRAPFSQQVSQTTYRYDGPLPQFKESAIIHLADGVEAASRALRKITPQHIGELIDQIIKDRQEDGQLADAPITFQELAKIKSSFNLTLVNMLHSRVAYPAPDPAEKSATPQENVAQTAKTADGGVTAAPIQNPQTPIQNPNTRPPIANTIANTNGK